MQLKIVKGAILNPISSTRCDFYPVANLILKWAVKKEKWVIQKIATEHDLGLYLKYHQKKIDSIQLLDYSDQIILPAFVDIHFHWVQDDVREMPKASLMDWLKNYTWPFEAKFKVKKWSEKKAKKFFSELPFHGTLAGAVYSSLHPQSVEHAHRYKQGHFVIGNPLMTMHSPDYLTHTEKVALRDARQLARKYREGYAFTPRFAPTTAPSLMKEGRGLQKQFKCFIQTHLSENKEEIQFVLDTFRAYPEFHQLKNYTEVYFRCGILGPKTIMGHAIHLAQSEWDLLKKTKTKIAHCPSSNAPIVDKGLGSGLFDFKKADKEKIDWALASDIGGGPYLCMLDVMRSFVQQNKKDKKANYIHAFYRATLAGASILNLGKIIGNFEQKKEPNFLVLEWPVRFKQKKDVSAESLLRALCEDIEREKLHFQIKEVFWLGEKLKRPKK